MKVGDKVMYSRMYCHVLALVSWVPNDPMVDPLRGGEITSIGATDRLGPHATILDTDGNSRQTLLITLRKIE